MDACFYGDFLFYHLSTRGAFCLVANEKYIICRIFKAVFQMINNTSAGTHAAAGDDDSRALNSQQLFMVLVFLDCVQTLEVKGMIALAFKSPGLSIPEFFQV